MQEAVCFWVKYVESDVQILKLASFLIVWIVIYIYSKSKLGLNHDQYQIISSSDSKIIISYLKFLL